MSRKKFVRRFEPRGGVSREMLKLEARYVAREAEDYRLLATNELRQKLAERQSAWRRAEQALGQQAAMMAERERLVLQCLVVRDLYHLLELYLAYLGRAATDPDTAVRPVVPDQVPTPPEGDREPVVPLSEWLFSSE